MHNKVKYAICYIYCSIGEATENSQIVWLTDCPLACVTELEDAQIFDDKATAEVHKENASQLITGVEQQFFNVVTINWHEESEENDE